MENKPYSLSSDFGRFEFAEQGTLFGEPVPRRSEFVYAMCRLGCVKIGYSARPRARARENGAILLAMTPGGQDLEERVHWQFRHLRYCHEFFWPEPSVLAWIASLPIQLRPWPHPHGYGPNLRLAA
jgi:hypothetical protein